MADVTPIARARHFATSDIGNAERLVARYGHDIRWLQAWKSWLVWDGTHWVRDETCQMEALAKSVVRTIYAEAAAADSTDRKKDLTKHALASEADGKVRAMLARAHAEPGIAIRFGDLDQHPWRWTCANGTLDLRTGRLEPHRREDLITKASPVHYDPGAPCPTWEAFLARIFDGNRPLIAYLQRAVGYSLTGDTSEQCLQLLHGSGSNGKSTFLETLAAVWGDYGVQADFTTFLDQGTSNGPRNDVARLAGARMVRSNEVGEGKRFNESLIKSLTGTDTIAARYLYAEAFEFRPQFKLWFAANHKPLIRGVDHAIWRRVRLVPFEVTIPDAEQDPELPAKLLDELPGILAWAVAGCLLWQRSAGLHPPESVSAATDAYRSESDVVGAFLDECCEIGTHYEVAASAIYGEFRRWAHDNGEYLMSQTALGRRLEERGFGVRKSSGKQRTGLRLNHAISKEPELKWSPGDS